MNLRGCVALSPVENKERQSAAEHVNLIKFGLQLSGESSSNVVSIIADKFTVKKSITELLGCNLIECASHRFNLADSYIITAYSEAIEMVKKVMGKLCFHMSRTKLGKCTALAFVKLNNTCWSSVSATTTYLVSIMLFLSDLEISKIRELLITRAIDKLICSMKMLDCVTDALQWETVKISKTRYGLDM